MDLDPQVEILLRRRLDGQAIVLCPNRESYECAVKAGVVAFSPREIRALLEGAREIGDPVALQSLVYKAVDVKRRIPGTKLQRLGDVMRNEATGGTEK